MLTELANTHWTGRAELWLDPRGNEVAVSDCTLPFEPTAVPSTWSPDGAPHHGTLNLRDGGADFTDTFHAPQPMTCVAAPASWALVDVFGTWSAGDGPPWGWRITVAHRPASDGLVLQMSIVKPWGEHGRAVRMVAQRA